MKKIAYSLLVIVLCNLALSGCKGNEKSQEEYAEMLPGVYFTSDEEEFYENEDGFEFSVSGYTTVEYTKNNTLERYDLDKLVFNDDSDNPVTYFIEFWTTGTWQIEDDQLIEKYDNVNCEFVYKVDNEDSDFYKIHRWVDEYSDDIIEDLLEDEQGRIISFDNDVLKLEYEVDGKKEEVKWLKL